jgi:hypothetical protein
LSETLEPLVEGVRENKKHWHDLAQNAQETIRNRKNSIKSMTNGGSVNNNNNYTYSNGNSIKTSSNNNNNGEEPIIISNETSFMSKIVGKFPSENCKVPSENSSVVPTYLKQNSSSNGLITSMKSPNTVTFNNWKKNEGQNDATDQ